VARVEYLGPERLVYGTLKAPHPPVPVVARLPATVTMSVKPRDHADFGVREHDLKQFDRASGVAMPSASK
jgi:multiple sugar transport system ATP-binding protein